MIGLLALKLVLSPTLIAMITLAGRRWGSAVAGWLAGLPITGGPILLILTLQRGEAYTAATARSSMVGAAAFAAFCIAFVFVARRCGWWWALVAGYIAYAAMMPLCAAIHPSTAVAALIGGSALLGCAMVLPQGPVIEVRDHSPWELPLRMTSAAAIVLVVTGLAHVLDPRWIGVLSIFPTAATVLGVFTHRSEGPNGAARVLRALTLGMLGYIAFLTVVTATLEAWGLVPAFGLALLTSFAAQATLWAVLTVYRRRFNVRAPTHESSPASPPPPA